MCDVGIKLIYIMICFLSLLLEPSNLILYRDASIETITSNFRQMKTIEPGL